MSSKRSLQRTPGPRRHGKRLPTPLWALLAECIDYAGIFPPARLELSDAVRNYAQYQRQDESWMLGRFVCPTSRLAELNVAGEVLSCSSLPLRFSAIARSGDTVEQLLANLAADVKDIQGFRTVHGEHVLVDVLEIRLPAEVFEGEDATGVVNCLKLVSDLIETSGPLRLTTFCEPPAWENLPKLIGGVGTQYSVLSTQYSVPGTHFADVNPSHSCRPFGMKLRTGGLDRSAFPSAEQLTAAIAACRDAGVFWKATAGLHQPLRHYDATLETWQHGFINVLAAAVLANAHKLDEVQIRQILLDDSTNSFRFDDEALMWNDLHVDVDQIRAARREAMISFGSCSITEPCDGLRTCGWL